MAKSNQRKNNNPEGRNQYSGWSARENPMTTAAAAAAAVGAGVFLWSRRNQISEQISSLGEQIGEWTESMRSGSEDELELAGAASETTGSASRRSGAGSRSSSNLSGNETA